MKKTLPILAALLGLAAIAGAAPAPAATGVSAAHGFAPRQLVVKVDGEAGPSVLRLPRGADAAASVAALRDNPQVAYAEPNYIATASGAAPFALPNDSGTLSRSAKAASTAGNWARKQWNFLDFEREAGLHVPISPGGIDAIGAWRNLDAIGRPGAAGIVVAVLDTGVAYRGYPPDFRRSPDLAPDEFVEGHDFVGHDRLPLDENGHGTHVASTIAERTGNGIGLTGLAYNAKIMPVRVLDAEGEGRASQIAKGIRWAVHNGAQVINMSFNFGCGLRVPEVDEALRGAYAHGVVVVASAGNVGSETCISQPATGPRVIAVGGSTSGGCLGEYSLTGKAIDLLAPGGGRPVPGCPLISDRPIYQVTLRDHDPEEFGIPRKYVGTSMAAAHVSAVAAMVLAAETYGEPGYSAGELRARDRVDAVTRQLRRTARSLGLPPGKQGAGLIDAAAATAPRAAPAP
jgi:serine protease